MVEDFLYIYLIIFDNQEGGIEGKEWKINMFQLVNMKLFKLHFKMKYLELSKIHKIILIYPIPEVGWMS